MKTNDTLLHLMAERAIQALRAGSTPKHVLRTWARCNYDLKGGLTPDQVLIYAEEAVELLTGLNRASVHGNCWTGWLLGAWSTLPDIGDLAVEALEEKEW